MKGDLDLFDRYHRFPPGIWVVHAWEPDLEIGTLP